MLDPKHPLAELLRRDKRYQFDAYVFVFDALRFGQEKMGLGQGADGPDASGPDASGPGGASLDALGLEDADLDDDSELEASAADELDDDEEHHVTGAELCRAIQRYAIEQYGMLAQSVLDHWGVRETGDFGEIVFNLIDIGQMRKTDNDRREDFDNVYDFAEAFGESVVFSADCVGGDEDEG